MFPAFAETDVERIGATMMSYARAMVACGGKRYPCGYFGTTEVSDWADHYGAAWSVFCRAKARFDPRQLFESGLVRWPAA